jgi:pimeloyl-ACP methyl ester carboxylesterase
MGLNLAHVRRTLAAAALLWVSACSHGTPAPAGSNGIVPSSDNVPIAFQVRGSGKPTLVLIHGWSCDSSYWAGQVDGLSRDYRVITVDLGGHGRSGSSRVNWTIDSFGEDVVAVVERLQPEQAILVGHSMGGDVAVAAARRLGGRVRGVVWVDTYRKLGSTRSADEVEEIVAPFAADFKPTTAALVRGMFPPGADKQLVARVAEDMSSAPPTIAVSALRSSLTYGRTITESIKGIRAPIVAINPDQPASEVQSMRDHGVEVVMMSGVGHFMMMEQPAQFNALLKQVVARHFTTPSMATTAR